MRERKMSFYMGQAAAILALCLLAPCLITWWWQGRIRLPEEEPISSGKYVRLEGREETEDLEEYLVRLLPAVMDADAPSEALKAQAVLLRTWCYRELDGRSYIEEKEIGIEPWTAARMQEEWGEELETCYLACREAVAGTAGRILTWNGIPVLPLYHAVSSGATRTGDTELFPWLAGADSSADRDAEGYLQIYTYTEKEFAEALNGIDSRYQVKESGIGESLQVIDRDEAGYIRLLMAGGIQFDGDKAAKALGLPSACVSFDRYEGKIRATCKGVGHGYGMSQAGACAMAEKGSSWQEILQYYFQNTEITE